MRIENKNAGFSLVELIVVIAIMSIMLGMTGIGISLMFSRDAEKCAVEIEGGLDKVRAYSMSKPGIWYLEVKQDPTDENVYMTIYRDEGNAGATYKVYEKVNLGSRAVIIPEKVEIWFNNASGAVKKVVVNDVLLDLTANDITKIEVQNSGNENKKKTVNLVHITGKHFIE